jgi:hypothetical protein
MTWMSGINRKITVMKRFCENVLLGHPVHCGKIKDSLTETEQKELDSCISDDGHFNAANRLVRKTIYTRAGYKGEVDNDNKVILHHILLGKPFDIVDMMFREIKNLQ